MGSNLPADLQDHDIPGNRLCDIAPEKPKTTGKLIFETPVFEGEDVIDVLDRISGVKEGFVEDRSWRDSYYQLCEFIDRNSNIFDLDGQARWRK